MSHTKNNQKKLKKVSINSLLCLCVGLILNFSQQEDALSRQLMTTPQVRSVRPQVRGAPQLNSPVRSVVLATAQRMINNLTAESNTLAQNVVQHLTEQKIQEIEASVTSRLENIDISESQEILLQQYSNYLETFTTLVNKIQELYQSHLQELYPSYQSTPIHSLQQTTLNTIDPVALLNLKITNPQLVNALVNGAALVGKMMFVISSTGLTGGEPSYQKALTVYDSFHDTTLNLNLTTDSAVVEELAQQFNTVVANETGGDQKLANCRI